MKKRSLLVFSLLLLGFILFAPKTQAAEFKTNKAIYIASDEIVDGNLYAIASDITIDGDIAGDLIALASSITINGNIAGDLIVATSQLQINGKIEGNARIASNSLNFNGYVGKNVNAIGQELYFNESSFVGWDVLAAGNIIFLKGTINGHVDADGGKIFINSDISKNVNLNLSGKEQLLNIAPDTKIGGNLNYTSKQETLIAYPENVKGQISFQENNPQKEKNTQKSKGLLLSIAMALVVASLFIYILKKPYQESMQALDKFKTKNLIPVFLFLILIPVAAIILAITIIGIPAAIIIFIAYGLILYLAKLVSAIFIGKLIFDKFANKKNFFLFISLGIVISWIIFALPVIGGMVAFLATIFGLSGLIQYVKNKS